MTNKDNTQISFIDGNGNQTSMTYPDSSVVNYTYDGVGNLKTVTESDSRTTSYSYDGMGRVVEMVYPHGWVETYHYDAIGQLLKVEDTDPTQKDMKQQKHVYEYDACGNMTYEYMRGNGTGEATVENFYTYDELHRVVYAKENYGNASRSYQYDSLGNLTWETNSNNVTVDYILNNLNQITSSTEDGWKTSTTFSYDARGNLVSEVYTKNKKVTTLGAYVYDETNKMVSGTNEGGEVSNYIYNGLGALVENQWIITKNGYGYHSVDAGDVEITYPATNLKKSSTVVKQFVVDYNTETFEPLMEYEVNGLDYKYVYGNDRLSVDITSVTNSMSIVENSDHIRLYYHMDYLGTTDYLTSPVSLKVTSWTHYNEWGEITHNAVLKCGQRELDLVKRYATHDYDNVLDLYYAKARFYDADNRRFVTVDPILDPSQYDIRKYVDDPAQLVQYLYVVNNPVIYIDPLGLLRFNGYELRDAIIGSDITGKSRDSDIYVSVSDINGFLTNLGYSFDSSISTAPHYNIWSSTYSGSYAYKKGFSRIRLNFNDIRVVNVDNSNPLYFVKLECAIDELEPYFGKIRVTEKSDIFRSTDYTTAKAKSEANRIADNLLETGIYIPKWYQITVTNRAYFYGTSLVYGAKVAAYHAVKDYTMSDGFYEDMLGTSVSLYSTFKTLQESSPAVNPLLILAASVVVTTIGRDAGYVDIDFDSTSGNLAAFFGTNLDYIISNAKGKEAFDAVEFYLSIKDTDLKYYLREYVAGYSGMNSSYPGIGTQFNEALITESSNYMLELQSQIGNNIAFIPSYVDAFNNRIESIRRINDKNYDVSIVPNAVTDQDIATEMGKIAIYDGNTFDW